MASLKRRARCLAGAGLAAVLYSALHGGGPAAGQARVPPLFGPDATFGVRWDAWGQRVLAFKSRSIADEDAVAIWDPKSDQIIRLSVIRDMVGRKPRRMGVWDVAAAPDGAVGVVGGLTFSKGEISNVIAVFDRSGRLAKLWNLGKYHHHRIAFDEAGALYAMGHRADENTVVTPLVIRYSARGQVEQNLMSAGSVGWIGAAEDLIEGTDPDLVATTGRVACLFTRTNEVVIIEAGKVARYEVDSAVRDALPHIDGEWRGTRLAQSGSRLLLSVSGTGAKGGKVVAHTRLAEVRKDGKLVPLATRDQPDGELWPHTLLGLRLLEEGPRLVLLRPSGSGPADYALDIVETELRR